MRFAIILKIVWHKTRNFWKYKTIFESKGLSYDDVRILQIKGFSFIDIVLMSDNEIDECVGRDATPKYTMPSNYIKVTNVGGVGSSAIEYFHPNTGMVSGDFYSSSNNGTYKDGEVQNFIKEVYDVSSTSGFSYKYYYWGQWGDSSIGTHQGHDMYSSSSNSAIYSLHQGTVKINSTFGAVLIYNSKANKTFIYAHLRDIAVTEGSTVSAGQFIGYESNVGVNGRHLHFEVRSGEVSKLASQSGLNTLNPYEWMRYIPWDDFNRTEEIM